MKKFIILLTISFSLTACTYCSEKDAVQHFKTSAWHGLIGPEAIWFPPANEMNVSGNVFGEYSCHFTTYGKKLGRYYECTLKKSIKCTIHGWLLVNQDIKSFSEVKDSSTIKMLENRTPDKFTPTKIKGAR